MAVTGTEAAIYEALVWYVGQQTFSPALKVAYPNVDFTPVLKTPFLAVDYFPNTSDLTALPFDSEVISRGILQIAVAWPSSEGLVKPSRIAAQIVQSFKPGTMIERNGLVVYVDEQPRVAPAIGEPNWSRMPVTIRWRAAAAPNA